MGQEILYTSAPQGLRPGASGFCTVCSTAGMEPNLAEFLEGFSGYPHPFKPPDPRTKENPVNYSHVQWTIGGQRYHILSRVADAGLDYTGRTNLLAHHVALPKREADRCPGGPAWVLSDPGDDKKEGFSITRWDGQLKTLSPRVPRSTDTAPAKCIAWEAAAGDAGYAGVLAETLKEKGGRPVVVIYPSHCDTLALLVEALSLLPPEKRWSVTFATLYSRIYSSFECQWRFVFHESAEARAARRDPHALVLDLTKGALPPARGGELVKLAREGVRAAAAAPQTRIAASAAAAPAPRQRSGAPPPMPLEGGDYKLAPPVAPTADLHSLPPEPTVNPFAKSNARRMSGMMPVAAAFLGGIALTLIVFIAMVMNQPPAPAIATSATNPPARPAMNITRPANNPRSKLPPDEVERPRPGKIQVVPLDVPQPAQTTGPSTDDPFTATPLVTGTPPATITSKTPEVPRLPNDPFEDIARRNNILSLPSKSGSGLRVGTSASNPLLAMVFVASPQEVELGLNGVEAAFGKLIGPNISFEHTDTETARTWQVLKKPTGAAGATETIGVFKLEKQKLTFEWGRAQNSARPESLRYCLLSVTVGAENRLCQLAPPVIAAAVRWPDKQNVPYELPSLSSNTPPDPAGLLMEVQPVDFGGMLEISPSIPVSVGEELMIFVTPGSGEVGPVLQLGVRLGFNKDNERGRIIEVRGRAAFKQKDIDRDEAIKTGGDLNSRIWRDRRDGARMKCDNFARQLKSAESNLKKNLDKLQPELDIKEANVRRAQDQLRKLKGEDEKRGKIVLEEMRKDVTSLKEAIVEMHAVVKEVEDKHKAADQEVADLDAVCKLVEGAIEKGRLEYRIFVREGEHQIEIFRSKGFE